MSYFFHQSKITKLYCCLVLDEHVLWLNISVEEAVLVNILERVGNLLYYMPDLFMREGIIIEFTHLHHAVKVHIQDFEQHVQAILMSNNFLTGYDVGML